MFNNEYVDVRSYHRARAIRKHLDEHKPFSFVATRHSGEDVKKLTNKITLLA